MIKEQVNFEINFRKNCTFGGKKNSKQRFY